MPGVVHFEIPADDLKRARGFYRKLFGWEIKEVEGVAYWMIETGGKAPACGGMMERQNPGQGITNYIDVPSVDGHSAMVVELGGRVVVEKKAVPGWGWFAVCLDTEGNTFGLWEDDKEAK